MKKKVKLMLLILAVVSITMVMLAGCDAPAADAPAADTPAADIPAADTPVAETTPANTEQNNTEQNNEEQNTTGQSGPRDIGEGGVVFTFEVVDDKGETTVWNVHTDAVTVGDALLEVGLIEGEMSGFGLMVIYVNGLRADYNEDRAYWAFYYEGEMTMSGVDAVFVEQGKVYAFVYTEA